MHDIHPLAEAYRNLTDAEFQALKKSIKKHGQQHPIHVVGELILDGRHRYRACRELGIVPLFEEYTGDDLEAFITALNDARRHETADERKARIDAALAKVTTKSGGNGSNQHKTAKVTPVTLAKMTVEDAAKEAGVSKRTLQRRKAALKKQAEGDDSPAKQKEKRHRTLASKAAEVIIERKLAGHDLPKSDEVAVEFGIQERQAAHALDQARTAIEAIEKVEPEISMQSLSLTAQQKLEICERKLRRDIEAEYDERVQRDVERILKEQVEPEIIKSIDFCRKWGKSYIRSRLPLSQEEFKKILVCLHPDRVQDDVMKRRFSQAFELFKSKEAQLVAPDAPVVPDGFAFPTNMAEFLRRRKVKTV